ncbi:MAG: (d)CMP kinase, partial [Pseudomonadota bacterium]
SGDSPSERRPGGFLSEVAADLIARDARDTARAASPLKPAPDAHILDTTGLSIEDAVTTAIDVVNAAH